jgi:hypothetical protein
MEIGLIFFLSLSSPAERFQPDKVLKWGPSIMADMVVVAKAILFPHIDWVLLGSSEDKIAKAFSDLDQKPSLVMSILFVEVVSLVLICGGDF